MPDCSFDKRYIRATIIYSMHIVTRIQYEIMLKLVIVRARLDYILRKMSQFNGVLYKLAYLYIYIRWLTLLVFNFLVIFMCTNLACYNSEHIDDDARMSFYLIYIYETTLHHHHRNEIGNKRGKKEEHITERTIYKRIYRNSSISVI